MSGIEPTGAEPTREVPPGDEVRQAFATAPFAVLATHGPDHRMDLVPCCFAVAAIGIVSAIDHKPKTTTKLARLTNIERNPAVTLLVDHRNPDDWSELWWVRVAGTAAIEPYGTDGHRTAVEALSDKYDQYRQRPPEGPAIVITPERWRSWGL